MRSVTATQRSDWSLRPSAIASYRSTMLRVLTLVAALPLGCGRTHFDDHPIGGAERDGALAVDGITPRPEPAAGCVLHYAMDEDSWTGDVVDSCGLQPGKALAGAAPIDDPQRGRVGGFTGGTSCVTTPDTSDLHMASGLTISAWIKPSCSPESRRLDSSPHAVMWSPGGSISSRSSGVSQQHRAGRRRFAHSRGLPRRRHMVTVRSCRAG